MFYAKPVTACRLLLYDFASNSLRRVVCSLYIIMRPCLNAACLPFPKGHESLRTYLRTLAQCRSSPCIHVVRALLWKRSPFNGALSASHAALKGFLPPRRAKLRQRAVTRNHHRPFCRRPRRSTNALPPSDERRQSIDGAENPLSQSPQSACRAPRHYEKPAKNGARRLRTALAKTYNIFR